MLPVGFTTEIKGQRSKNHKTCKERYKLFNTTQTGQIQHEKKHVSNLKSMQSEEGFEQISMKCTEIFVP